GSVRSGHQISDAQSALVLVREGEALEVEVVGLTEEAVEVDGKGMGGELAVEACGEAIEGVGVVLFDVPEVGELTVDGLDDLAPASLEGGECRRELGRLVLARHGQQGDAGPGQEVGGDGGAEVPLVADDAQ